MDNQDCRREPCAMCTQNCLRIHGGKRSNGCFYFFKIMLGNFSERLRIPPAFVGKLRNRTNENVILEGPSSQRWSVKLCYTSIGMEFQKGWEKFVCDHGLDLGDFLVFKYTCKSYFTVQIFGRSGCEKKNVFNMKNFGASLLSLEEKTNHDAQDNCPNTLVKSFNADWYQAVPKCTNSKTPIISYADEDSNDQAMGTFKFKQCVAETCPPNPAKHPRHGISARTIKNTESCQPSFTGKKHKIVTSPETGGKSYLQAYYVSCRRPVTQAERSKALDAANSFKSNKRFALIVMKPSHVYQGFWLAFPRRFENCFQLPKERMQVTLLGPNKEYKVQYLGDRLHPGLSGGWRYFSLDNNVEEGDVCVFELVNTIKYCFKVHIFRVVKKCTPFKKMEGTKMNDKDGQCKIIAHPVNHFKKMKVSTMSTKKIATNSAVQPSGRHIPDILEQGIVAKQEEKEVQKKKGHSSSPDILERGIVAKQEEKQVQKKKGHSSSPNNFVEKAKCICDNIKDRRSSPRFNKVCNSSEHLKKQLPRPAFATRQQTIDRNTMPLSGKTNNPLDDMNGETDLIIIWDSNDVAGPSKIIPSQESIRERPSVIKSKAQVVKQESQA